MQEILILPGRRDTARTTRTRPTADIMDGAQNNRADDCVYNNNDAVAQNAPEVQIMSRPIRTKCVMRRRREVSVLRERHTIKY